MLLSRNFDLLIIVENENKLVLIKILVLFLVFMTEALRQSKRDMSVATRGNFIIMLLIL